MDKLILKVDCNEGRFRVQIPRNVVREIGWENERYVLLDPIKDGKLTLRRLVIEEDS